jgi:branched-chain amino acid transport system permease protein
MGLAGSLYSMFITFAHIHNGGFNTSIMILLMTDIGGMGTPFGPVIGAFIIVVASDTASAYWERWPFILGVICILLFYLLGEESGV